MTETIPHWLDKQAALSPNDIAIETPFDKQITFLQLKNESRSFAKKLARLGVSKSDHVAIYASNSIEMTIAIHALSYLGAVAVLLNTRLTKNEIAFQLTDAKAAFILTSSELLSQGVIAAQGSESKPDVFTFTDIDKEKEEEVSLKDELFLDDLFTIIYTSGTTGLPKGVKHTYGNHWWSAISSALNLGLDGNDKWLASLPLFHVGGLSLLMKSVIYGMPIYLLKKFEVETVHDGIMNKGITIVSVVTIMLQRLMDKLGDQTYPPSFRCMLLGGGPAPKPLLETAKSHSIPVFQTYGMTETSSQIVTLSPKYALEKLGSAGQALFPAQLKIVTKGTTAASFEVGEICVKGPMVTSGYYCNEEANDKTFTDGWLATGDLGYIDKEGFLYVMDRRKDLIISGGENIYPAEVESALSGMPGIKEVGVIGKEDNHWGHVPVAFVVADHQNLTAEAIVEYAKLQLAKYKVPKQIHFVDELPRNASNKLVRYKLSALLDNNY